MPYSVRYFRTVKERASMATANLSVESKDFTLPVVEATAGADG